MFLRSASTCNSRKTRLGDQEQLINMFNYKKNINNPHTLFSCIHNGEKVNLKNPFDDSEALLDLFIMWLTLNLPFVLTQQITGRHTSIQMHTHA